MEFEMKNRDAAGRIGKLTTAHGSVTTPSLLPVINPNKMIITPKEMKKLFGTEMVITNSYIIRKSDSLRSIALEKGVHKLIDFDGPIMTDSGTFQSYIYGDVNVDPLEIVSFQRDIGSDIGTILDIFGTPDQTKVQAEDAVKETIIRAKASIPLKYEMNIATTVQGGVYPWLRTMCAQQLAKLNPDLFPIGGVVPLMENQCYVDLVKVILASKKGLPSGKPVHLFGAGHPMVFSLAVALGCDLFDSSAYVKYALQDRLVYPWGTKKLADISELGCQCPICSSYSAEELRKCSKQQRIKLIAKHNLYVSTAELKRIRNAIVEGCLWEHVERIACVHPTLIDAVKELRQMNHKEWLERQEPIYKRKAFFYTSDQTIHRPLIVRLHQRLIDYLNDSPAKFLLLPEREKPYQMSYSKELQNMISIINEYEIVVETPLGPIPIWLDEMYPFAQSVFPKGIDYETKEYVTQIFSEVLKEKKIITLDKFESMKIGREMCSKEDLEKILDQKRVRSVAWMQFGKIAVQPLFHGGLQINKSKKTGKIRTVFCDDVHVLSMRASDGLFTLKKDGAKRIHSYCPSPFLRVVIDDDAVPFVEEGKSVFAKFVKNCDHRLRPFDECLIVDNNDSLIAVGRCLLNREEMLSFSHGIAVKNRESC